MAPAPPPVGGLPENQNRGAQTVKSREKERARNETSTADATPNASTGATKCRKRAATTSTALPPPRGYISSGMPAPLHGAYGVILNGGRN